MIDKQKIIQELNIIESQKFQYLIDDLINAGAFKEISEGDELIESTGVNIEKNKTTRSDPYPDSIIKSRELFCEYSVEEKWLNKFKDDVLKNKGKSIKTFVFASNRNLRNNNITIDKRKLSMVDYCKQELNCEKAFILGQKEIVIKLTQPKYFNIRRNYLNIKEDLFVNYDTLKSILKDKINIDLEKISESDLKVLESDLIGRSDVLMVNGNDPYHPLNALIQIAEKNYNNRKVIDTDFVFICWPQTTRIIDRSCEDEVKNLSKNNIIIWNADSLLDTITDYLGLKDINNKIIFICRKDKAELIKEKVNSFSNKLSIATTIFDRKINSGEKDKIIKEHLNLVAKISREFEENLLKYEAFIYFYTPFRLDNISLRKRIRKYLNIKSVEENILIKLLLANAIIGKTGNMLWLTNLQASMLVSDKLINEGLISIEDLIRIKNGINKNNE